MKYSRKNLAVLALYRSGKFFFGSDQAQYENYPGF
jgi:hypothetical protein